MVYFAPNFKYYTMDSKGVLIAIGGNEDKGTIDDQANILDFVNDGILSTVVKESGGINAKIVVIPTASSIPIEVGENYLNAFTKLGCDNIMIMDIRNREHCEKPVNIKAIRDADCIMFSGGDQSRIVDIIGGTTIHDILSHRFQHEHIVIAGTSAGAMAMSTEMIYGGSSTESLLKDSVLMRDGMGFIPGLIIDSHFIRRGRFGRLTEAVAKFPDLTGVGLAEDTGMIIRNRNQIQVIGSGMIIIFDGSNLTHNNEEILPPGTPMTIANLKVHVLANSDEYVLDKKLVRALPIGSEFGY